MNRKLFAIILIIGTIAVFLYFIITTDREVEMLLINGKIYTLDSNNTIVDALAIRGSRIVAIGSSDALLNKYKAEEVVDLKGKTVLPGFIDGHCHMFGLGSLLNSVNLVGTTSAEQVVELVKERVRESLPGQIIFGRGWDQNDWEIKEFPDRFLLDKVAPENPVILRRVDGHMLWVNTNALELAGINKDTKDPEGGKIYRDAQGEPTGILLDNAMDLVEKKLPPPTDLEVEAQLKLAIKECLKYGLTQVHDMGVDLQTIRVYKKLIDNNECPLRIYAALQAPGEPWSYYQREGKEIGYGNGFLTVRAVKLFIDGALGSRGAALFEEYSDDPGNRGLTLFNDETIEYVARHAIYHGFQVCTHAIGDRGNYLALKMYEKVFNMFPEKAKDIRWRIEHAQVLRKEDIPEFVRLGILPSMQPTHATSDMYWAEARLGSERIKGAYAWQSLLSTGSIIIGGSDFPVESVNPLWGIYAAITRCDHSGYPPNGWYGEQRMTREQAVRSFTQWAAYGAFEEDVKGTIEIGKLADLTVLSNDIMEIPPQEILNTVVEMTIVNGKIVYHRLKEITP